MYFKCNCTEIAVINGGEIDIPWICHTQLKRDMHKFSLIYVCFEKYIWLSKMKLCSPEVVRTKYKYPIMFKG